MKQEAVEINPNTPESESILTRITAALVGIADVTAVYTSRKELLVKGNPLINLSGMKDIIASRLAVLNMKTEVLSTEPSLVVRMRSREMDRASSFPWVNLALFVLTVFTTLAAGAIQEGVNWFSNPGLFLSDPGLIISRGLPFSVSLLAILLVHEFGHYIASRLHKVNVSLPYFIPAPTLVGTFGAVIKSKSVFMNKRQLLDVGAAGPLAGLIVAIIVLIIGINGSPIRPIPADLSGTMYFGDSLLHRILTYAIKGPIPDGQVMYINSIAFAGWVGLLVTMLNLLPIGQLDGGHITYALFGKSQRLLANLTIIGLVVLSFWWSGWVVWLILTLFLRPAHPPTLMDEAPIGWGRRMLGYASIAAFILCFVPVPVVGG